ncbi:MAG: hypothetical protein K9K38_14175 [Rhodoferax sp.]|nr:hypothetical protein [Rhodoferax sp.]
MLVPLSTHPNAYLQNLRHDEMNLDGYNWTMDRRVYLKSVSDLEDVVGLIAQSYKNVI